VISPQSAELLKSRIEDQKSYIDRLETALKQRIELFPEETHATNDLLFAHAHPSSSNQPILGTNDGFMSSSANESVQDLFSSMKHLRTFVSQFRRKYLKCRSQVNRMQGAGDELQLYGPTSILWFSPNTVVQPTQTIEDSPSYVLLVDGIDSSHFDRRFDWSLHLPPEIFITRHEHDKFSSLFQIILVILTASITEFWTLF
jgi:hypothetical protein